MKKFLSLLLTLTMVLSLSITAFAADNEKTVTSVTEDNTASFDVTGTANVTEGNYADIAYSVKVEWTVGALELDIDNTELYTWDAATLKYVKATPAAANFEPQTVEATITLTNSSNAAVNYTIAYADNSDNLTTSEATKTGDKTGKLANADITAAASAANEESGHDYAIDTAKVTNNGEVTTASYTGTVSLTALGDTSAIENGSTLTLGTYTVTLSAAAPVVETKTVSDILALAATTFPTTKDNGWQDTANNKTAYFELGKLYTDDFNINMYAVAEKVGDDYVAVITDGVSGETHTLTFLMTGNVLTSITYAKTRQGESTPYSVYTFTPPTT